MQSPNHLQRQRAPTVEHFVYSIAAANERDEVARLKPILVHVILYRLKQDPAGRLDSVGVPKLRPA